jgi:hypothetical protein
MERVSPTGNSATHPFAHDSPALVAIAEPKRDGRFGPADTTPKRSSMWARVHHCASWMKTTSIRLCQR